MAIEGREKCLGLTIKPRQRRNVKAEKVTDLYFADRIALFSHQFQQAQFNSIQFFIHTVQDIYKSVHSRKIKVATNNN